jgi:hypothetical protein
MPDSVKKELSVTDKAKAKKGLESCEGRMTAEDYATCERDLDGILNPVSIPFHWEDGGEFTRELELRNRPDMPVQEMEAKIMIVEAPAAILARNHAAMRSNMQDAQERGLDGSKIVFGAIIAVRVDHSAPEQQSEGTICFTHYTLSF